MITTAIVLALIVLIIICFCILFLRTPSNRREWSLDQAVLPYAEFDTADTNERVTIHNIRNFSYRSTTDYTPSYYDRTFDIDRIRSLDYIVERFTKAPSTGHTLLSFGFKNGQYIAISIEIRKKMIGKEVKKSEKFSAIKGLFRSYELMYVVADERDVVKLRSNYRKDDICIYPLNFSNEQIRMLFLDILGKVNKLKEHAEFYNTLTNSCTVGIFRHFNLMYAMTGQKKIPFDTRMLLNGNSDRLIFDLGLIKDGIGQRSTLEQLKEKYHINKSALLYADDPLFSEKIRSGI